MKCAYGLARCVRSHTSTENKLILHMLQRRSFSATAQAQSAMNGSTSVILSLVEIWKPIQAEVRLMLHEYLTEDEEGTGSSRNPVASLNDVLRGTKSARDTSKVRLCPHALFLVS